MATRRIRVGVVFGGRSDEHDVSVTSVFSILRHLDKTRFEAVPIGITREGEWITGGDSVQRLASESRLPLPEHSENGSAVSGHSDDSTVVRVNEQSELRVPSDANWIEGLDVVFPVLHGPMGEDGTVQGLLELAGMPYVGSGVLGSAVAMDKITAKLLFERAGIPVAPWIDVKRRDWHTAPGEVEKRIAEEIGFPCFVKPSNMGSSVGVFKVHDQTELEAAMDGACSFDRRILVEQSVDARELEVSVLGNEDPISSIVGEIVPGHEFYDYEAKYVDDSSQELIPAPIPEETSDRIRELAIEAFALLDCAGLARVDFFLDRNNDQIFINEINTIPGFTPISMYPKLWEATGIPYGELISRLIDLAIERHEDKQGR